MLLCFVAFGQKSSAPTVEYPTKATSKAEKKQVTNQQKQPYASFNDVPEQVFAGIKEKADAKKQEAQKSRNAIRANQPYESLTSMPAATIEAINSRKASAKAKKVVAALKSTTINRTANSSEYADASNVVLGTQTVTYEASNFNGYSYRNSGNTRMPELAYSSGPYFGIAGTPDVSLLEDTSLGMGTYGSNANTGANFRMADDIVLSDDYDITSMVFYAYQTGAPTAPASIQEINVQIWDGDPSVGGSSVIWGDPTTNVMSSNTWSGAYRQLESAPGATNRAIQEITVNVAGLSLPAGTYWVDFSYVGDAGFSGPWQPPVNIIGQSTTGNAMQSNAGVWGPLVDIGAQGVPIDVYGDCTSCGGGGGCATGVYTDRAAFDAETGGLPVEDLAGGPSAITQCGVVISNAGDSCYAAGEILPGIEITSNNSAGGQTVYVDPGDGFGNTIPVVGSNTFVDYTILNFPNNDVNSFGFDLITLLGTGPVEVRIFGVGGQIDTQVVNATNPESFWGYIAGETVVSVEIEDLSGANVELVGMIAFGECAGGGTGCTAGTFGDRPSFEGAFGGTLIDEDFTGGPGAITACDGPINSGGNSCYPAGEIVDGIDIRSLVPTDPLNDTVVIPDGALGNVGVYVGPNTFVDVLEIQFPNNDVNSFGVDIIMPLVGSPTNVDIRIFGTGGQIDTQSATVTGNATPVFFGYIASETITRVEIEDPNGGGELIANASFGECTGGGGGGGCGDITYENVSPTGNGVPAQTFPDFPDFDCEAVDDVVLAGPDAGQLCAVSVTGTYTAGGLPADPNNTVVLTVYDDNAGEPGSVIFTETFPGSVDGNADGSFTLEPTGGPTFNPGTRYWISVNAVMEFGTSGQWFWSSATDGNDDPALWQNPGGGFGVGCTTWGDFATCTVGGGLGPDLLMDVDFEVVNIITYDDCEGALPINCGDSVMGDTLSATLDPVTDCDPGTPDAPGVWYKFEDTSGLPGTATASTCSGNTDYDTQIAVYTGDCNGGLVCLATNDDSPNCTNFQSEVEFPTDGSSTYYIMVHGWNNNTGNFELSLSCVLTPPDNDMIVNAIDIDQFNCPYTDEDVAMPAATTENGNPTDCDITGANGVWYKFTGLGDGFITGTIASPAGTYAITFYTAPDETSTEDELVLVDYFENQCVLQQNQARIPYVDGQSYYCFVLNTGGVTDIEFTECTLDVSSNTIEGFTFYPNPANDRLNLTSVEMIESVALYNILGQKVIDLDVNATNSQIDVSKLSVGAYIMKVSSNGQTGTYKVIKK
ncbi:MAG: T9SS type A sorting domain-containing protein [Flavobacteriaceae bacterium]